MNPLDPSPSARATNACPRCGSTTGNPFPAAGGVCLRCAGERALALGSDTPFEPETPATPSVEGDSPSVAGDSADLPASIGPYEIIEELGRGGMGRVFAARQRRLGRIVALKALPLGRDVTLELELRFLREAQTVARLRHPHIVVVHDSGRVPGYVYFSMDYLADGDLGRAMKTRVFHPREAAALVAKVADALACAHAAGVLHRDLKPSNILLDGGEPLLADFGLATQLETSGDLTSASGIFGTPHYLAPEALRGGAGGLTAASDLYALGVVLYALLTGRTPFSGASLAELAGFVGIVDPPPPHLLAPNTPRDLETICLKCLERDPARRYATAAALAADLAHFLAGEPINARPPGRLERLARFARRHRSAVVATLAIATVLVAATAVSSVLAVRARRAQELAAREAASNRAVVDFLQNDLLAQAAPDQQPNRDLPLRTVLDRAAKKIDGRFPDQPLVEASLRDTLAATYESLGESAADQHQLEQALALRRAQLGPDDPAIFKLTERLAVALASQNKLKEAEPLAREAAARAERVLGPANPATLHADNDLIYTVKALGHLTEAEAIARRTLATARAALGPDHNETRDATINLSAVLFAARKLDEAEQLNVEALAAEQRVLGPEHPDTLTVMSNLASVYWAEEKFAEAEKLNRQILDVRRRVLGPEHPETLRSMANLSTTLSEEGKYAEAEQLLQQVLDIRRRVLGPEHGDTLLAAMNLSILYFAEKRLDEAQALGTQTLASAQRALGHDHFMTLSMQTNLARFYSAAGRMDDAETLFSEVLHARQRLSGPENMQTLQATDALGNLLVQRGRFSEARALLEPELALREKLSPAPLDWHTAYTRGLLGAALGGEHEFTRAEPLLLESQRILTAQAAAIPASGRMIVPQIHQRLVEFYTAWGKPAEAETWQAALNALQKK
jgi:hypothetical protein